MHRTYISEWEDILETQECQLIRNKIPTIIDMQSGIEVDTPISFCAFIKSFFATLERKLYIDDRLMDRLLANSRFISLMYVNYREKINRIQGMEVK